MSAALRLLCVLAHPDDETLGLGGALARCAAEGIETYLLTATRGERGWRGVPPQNPGPEALGRLREAELRAAAEILGLREVTFLDYMDGDLDQAEPLPVIRAIAGHVRRVRPQVVVTFGPEGAYGHPDHIAVSQYTAAAVVCAVDPAFHTPGESGPHRVSKLYYLVDGRATVEAFPQVFDELVMTVDGRARRAVPWEEWAVTTRVDARGFLPDVLRAVACHQTQAPSLVVLGELSEAQLGDLLCAQAFYRVFSAVNGGRAVETDLFEGLR